MGLGGAGKGLQEPFLSQAPSPRRLLPSNKAGDGVRTSIFLPGDERAQSGLQHSVNFLPSASVLGTKVQRWGLPGHLFHRRLLLLRDV